MSELESWIGRQSVLEERLDPARARAMQATLDHPPELSDGDALPPLWHWLYFWDTPPIGALGADGHAARGGFLPPVELPYRMWAGGRLRFDRPPMLGAPHSRRATITGIQEKAGRSGPLTFVTVRHEIAGPDGPCLEEEQDIVYRGPRPPDSGRTGRAAPVDAAWTRAVSPGPVLLFRYSALTFNGHRIHYDHPYATREEGYPGLVVHGPLLATLLADLLIREGGQPWPRRFEFRAHNPVFDCDGFTLAGRPDGEDGRHRLWVADHAGTLAMEATADV